jgi:hypothetical protein
VTRALPRGPLPLSFPPFSFYLKALPVLILRSVGDGTLIEYEAVGEIAIGRGDRKSRRKPVPLSFSPQMPYQSNPVELSSRDMSWPYCLERN